jgi:hypothetical protein
VKEFTDEQWSALESLMRAFKKCRKFNIGFFVQEDDLIALPDRDELVVQVGDHDYIRENGESVDHSGTIIDCGAWD